MASGISSKGTSCGLKEIVCMLACIGILQSSGHSTLSLALLQVTEKGMEAHLIQPDIDRAGTFCMYILLTANAA